MGIAVAAALTLTWKPLCYEINHDSLKGIISQQGSTW